MTSAVATLSPPSSSALFLLRTVDPFGLHRFRINDGGDQEVLSKAGLIGASHTPAAGTPLLLLRRFMHQTGALCQFTVIESQAGGSTEAKTDLILGKMDFGRSDLIAMRVMHLMGYARENAQGEVILLSTIKPCVGNSPVTPLMRKADAGSESPLILNEPQVQKMFPNTVALDQDKLAQGTGAERHAVNFLVTVPEEMTYRTKSLLDPAIAELFYASSKHQLHFIEVPLAEHGDRFSCLMPLESFLAFLPLMKQHFPYFQTDAGLELQNNVGSAMKQLAHVLDPKTLPHRLKRNDKRPVEASFGAFASQLAKEFKASAPYVSDDLAKRATQNFVRHFLKVEYDLVQEAFSTEDPAILRSVFDRLAVTEYGNCLLPCDDFATFCTKINTDRSKRTPVPFSFSSETSKSDVYLSWLEKMGDKFEIALAEAGRKKETSADAIEVLKTELCKACSVGASGSLDSMQSAVDDFVDMIFSRHLTVLSKLEDKVRVLHDPAKSSDPVAAEYYQKYLAEVGEAAKVHAVPGRSLEKLGAAWKQVGADFNVRGFIAQQLVPEAMILAALPFSERLFGNYIDIVDRTIRNFAN